MGAERAGRVAALLAACLLSGCAGSRPPTPPAVGEAPPTLDALAVSDALEEQIDLHADTPAGRERAYEALIAAPEDTAAYALARATVTGRVVQERGLRAAGLVGDVERWAIRSRDLDPSFRDGAATRLLGTLYVLAPARFLSHGDSERGVALLEELVNDRPDVPENQLRLGEAYMALDDPLPAERPLCAAFASRTSLRPSDQELLDDLLEASGARCGSAP
ncbi:MAG TPA: hypothetical protein VMW35_11775 [Myxococcota bacterium]|jgi:hypothetical protein|nr:hypothetical protein [Myxococcota bacterium]